MTRILTTLACSLALVGCGGGTASTSPTITITSPAAGATVTVPSNKMVPVAFTLTGFTMMAPGACGATANCGHAHLLVDGSACNASGSPYNSSAVASPGEVDLSLCSTATGAHTILIELHNDAHQAIQDSTGKTVSSSVSITAQ